MRHELTSYFDSDLTTLHIRKIKKALVSTRTFL